jgi:hypothetical protein
MGTRNRERRKAKQKREQRHRQSRTSSRHGADFADLSPAELAEALVTDASIALRGNDSETFEQCLKLLVEVPVGAAARQHVDQAVLACLQRAIGHAWMRGWQPADLARIVGRQLGARHVRLAVDVVAAQMRGYAAATVDARWDAQLKALDARVWWDHDDRYVERWANQESLDRGVVIRCAVEVLSSVDSLPEIPLLCPRPGAARHSSPHSTAGTMRTTDQRMLDRVRALLAKAESTEFPEEAEAFTAKAQELMARHSIDEALLAAQKGSSDQPGGVRVGIDNPYEAAKALLLQKVAEANRCRTIWSKQLGFATVFGFPSDIDAVDLLYTSLLVQGTTAMVLEGSRRDGFGRTRTRSFRQSFLNAYAIRIGQRLHAAAEDVGRKATAEDHDRLLPVLAARDDRVREAVESLFPTSVQRQVSINNRDGWVSGTAAADLASLHVRREVPRQ